MKTHLESLAMVSGLAVLVIMAFGHRGDFAALGKHLVRILISPLVAVVLLVVVVRHRYLRRRGLLPGAPAWSHAVEMADSETAIWNLACFFYATFIRPFSPGPRTE